MGRLKGIIHVKCLAQRKTCSINGNLWCGMLTWKWGFSFSSSLYTWGLQISSVFSMQLGWRKLTLIVSLRASDNHGVKKLKAKFWLETKHTGLPCLDFPSVYRQRFLFETGEGMKLGPLSRTDWDWNSQEASKRTVFLPTANRKPRHLSPDHSHEG